MSCEASCAKKEQATPQARGRSIIISGIIPAQGEIDGTLGAQLIKTAHNLASSLAHATHPEARLSFSFPSLPVLSRPSQLLPHLSKQRRKMSTNAVRPAAQDLPLLPSPCSSPLEFLLWCLVPYSASAPLSSGRSELERSAELEFIKAWFHSSVQRSGLGKKTPCCCSTECKLVSSAASAPSMAVSSLKGYAWCTNPNVYCE